MVIYSKMVGQVLQVDQLSNGTYLNVPLTTNGDGKDAKATFVVSGNAVTSVTITEFGYGYDIGDTITADDLT